VVRTRFSGKLGELLDRESMTQAALARLVNRSRSAVSEWKAGRSEPDLETTAKICVAFDVSADWLLGISAEADVAEASAPYGEAQLEQARREIRALRDRLSKIAQALDNSAAGGGAGGSPPKRGRRKLR
jgi:transcriptional regulator with XRE-family HTH domain